MATPLTPELVDKLLDKLGSDEQFRADFQDDPEAAMLQLGAPADFVYGGCMRPKPLASKEAISRARELLRDTLLGKSGHAPLCLEAK
jgi:putative modified peptide